MTIACLLAVSACGSGGLGATVKADTGDETETGIDGYTFEWNNREGGRGTSEGQLDVTSTPMMRYRLRGEIKSVELEPYVIGGIHGACDVGGDFTQDDDAVVEALGAGETVTIDTFEAVEYGDEGWLDGADEETLEYYEGRRKSAFYIEDCDFVKVSVRTK